MSAYITKIARKLTGRLHLGCHGPVQGHCAPEPQPASCHTVAPGCH